MFPPDNQRPLFTAAEAIAAALALFLASPVVVMYFTDRLGFVISPPAALLTSTVAMLAALRWLLGRADRHMGDVAAFGIIVATMLAYLAWLSWPDLVPPGGGADLAHHLQLVEYIDRHWRLVHDASVEPYFGEMVHYTPGAHLLASLWGRWTGADGFRAIYPILAFAVALKAGFIFLIARRSGGQDRGGMAIPFAILAVALLLMPRALVLGSFTRFSYIAQIVSETFAVVMWWSIMVWDQRPATAPLVLIALAGVGVFLTWPVWIGPLLLVFATIVVVRSGMSMAERIRALAIGSLPIAVVAIVHAIGRLSWTGIVRTDARTALPTFADFGWPFLLFAIAGLTLLAIDRRGRATVLLALACGLQAAALYVAAKSNGAEVPYMAIKMAYLIVYLLAIAAAVAVARGTALITRWTGPFRWSAWLPWGIAIVAIAVVAVQAIAYRLPKPTVSVSLYEAGRWARDHIEPACVEYIVGPPDGAYWVHLAVLGNPRMSARTADDSTFEARDAIVRWIKPGGLPYAIADLGILPRDVLESSDELARFGSAVVIKKRGPTTCTP